MDGAIFFLTIGAMGGALAVLLCVLAGCSIARQDLGREEFREPGQPRPGHLGAGLVRSGSLEA